MILTEKILLEDLIKNSNGYYPDRIKFCIDKSKSIVSIDEEYHIDMENELYTNGSNEKDIYGGDIVFDPNIEVVWESHPNIARNKELGIGQGRFLSDENVKEELFNILKSWII